MQQAGARVPQAEVPSPAPALGVGRVAGPGKGREGSQRCVRCWRDPGGLAEDLASAQGPGTGFGLTGTLGGRAQGLEGHGSILEMSPLTAPSLHACVLALPSPAGRRLHVSACSRVCCMTAAPLPVPVGPACKARHWPALAAAREGRLWVQRRPMPTPHPGGAHRPKQIPPRPSPTLHPHEAMMGAGSRRGPPRQSMTGGW